MTMRGVLFIRVHVTYYTYTKCSYHWNNQGKYTKAVSMYDETFSMAVMEFIKENRDILVWLNSLYRKLHPRLFRLYCSLRLPYRFFGAWAAAVLNLSFPCFWHNDHHDYREGMCCIFYYSNGSGWTGGELMIDELGVKVVVKPGDVLWFRSHLFHHWVQDFVGERCSMVLFTHHYLFARDNDYGNAPPREIPVDDIIHCQALDEENLNRLHTHVQQLRVDANEQSRLEKGG